MSSKAVSRMGRVTPNLIDPMPEMFRLGWVMAMADSYEQDVAMSKLTPDKAWEYYHIEKLRGKNGS
mgnify:CR=1 FL=1